MATLENVSPGTAFASFTPISSALNGLPNGAGTIAALINRQSATANQDMTGLVNTGLTNWYHTLTMLNDRLFSDDGIVGETETPTWVTTTGWYIIVVTWPSGGAALDRFHHVYQTTPAGWTHSNSAANNGGNRAGPGTSNGAWRIGYMADNNHTSSTYYALVAAWAGVALSDAQCAELSVNNKTSDWWNNSGGQPTLLIECNTATPTDIGANPSTFSSIGGLTLTGSDPTWTFDGHGSAPPPAGSTFITPTRVF